MTTTKNKQKVFNTNVALSKLARDGVTAASAASPVTAKEVVDGDRDATLRLLWAIIARYSLSALLDREALAREAEGVVNAARKWRHAGSSPKRPARRDSNASGDGGGVRSEEAVWMGVVVTGGGGGVGCGRRGDGVRSSPFPAMGRAVAGSEHPPLEMPDVGAMVASWKVQRESVGDDARCGGRGGGGSLKRGGRERGGKRSGGGRGRGKAGGRARTGDEELLQALLVWCQAVCHGYGVPVRNFTTSFADGRALCLLLHYYHPRVRLRTGKITIIVV